MSKRALKVASDSDGTSGAGVAGTGEGTGEGEAAAALAERHTNCAAPGHGTPPPIGPMHLGLWGA